MVKDCIRQKISEARHMSSQNRKLLRNLTGFWKILNSAHNKGSNCSEIKLAVGCEKSANELKSMIMRKTLPEGCN